MEILRKSRKDILDKLGKYFFPIIIAEIILFTWLNSETVSMSVIRAYYNDFAAYILSGFSNDFKFRHNSSTFPMWGFGYVFAITKNDTVLRILQQAFVVFTLYKSFSILRAMDWKESTIDRIKIFFIFFGATWWIFHSHIWPYSISANLLLLSILYLVLGEKQQNNKHFITSALLYGLLLNFRSDYLYFGMFVLCVLLVKSILKRCRFLNLVSWFGIVSILLLPWALHTKRSTGEYLLSSTNAGHVLYISLGQLAGNKWGITPVDSDPQMKKIVFDNFGYRFSASYEADKLLKSTWKKLVTESPIEYARKVGSNATRFLIRPFTTGDIYRKFVDSETEVALKAKIKEDVRNLDILALVGKIFSTQYLAFGISFVLNIINIFCFLFFMFYLVKGLIRLGLLHIINKPILLIGYSLIGYQIAMLSLAFYNPNYNTNIFPFYIIVTALLISEMQNQKHKKKIDSIV